MQHLTRLYEHLMEEQHEHAACIYNYTIPEAWNVYGFAKAKKTAHREYIVNPYEFYSFQISHIMKQKIKHTSDKKRSWLKKSILYYHAVSYASAWDHDRSDRMERKNLYGLCDHGTFVKSIALLPMYHRMGINTLILDMPVKRRLSDTVHDFSDPHAIEDWDKLHPDYYDPIAPDLSIEEQYLAFAQAAKRMGIKIIWSMHLGTMSNHTPLRCQHPEWFYWMDAAYLKKYHAPQAHALPTGCEPTSEVRMAYDASEDVIIHKKQFHSYTKEEAEQLCVAPAFSDRINTDFDIFHEYTILRFYQDDTALTPFSMRRDLHPGRKPMSDLWQYLNQLLQAYVKDYDLDGVYIKDLYYLPSKLVKQLISTIHKANTSAVVLLEETDMTQAIRWKKDGADAISGNSFYQEYQLEHHKLHAFCYHLKDQYSCVFAGCEGIDTPRIITRAYGSILARMLHSINLFLPNSIPFYVCGMECGEHQPLSLSLFEDPQSLMTLPKEDLRCFKQGLLDLSYIEYRDNMMYELPKLLEQLHQIRASYIDAIVDLSCCIPVWFDSDKIDALGFAYYKEDKALLFIANTNVKEGMYIHAHTQIVLHHLPFSFHSICQIFSTYDPYTYEIQLDPAQNLTLYYEPGEVKFFELS